MSWINQRAKGRGVDVGPAACESLAINARRVEKFIDALQSAATERVGLNCRYHKVGVGLVSGVAKGDRSQFSGLMLSLRRRDWN
jgi:hypothetical protein